MNGDFGAAGVHIDNAVADLSSAAALWRRGRFARVAELLQRASAELTAAANTVNAAAGKGSSGRRAAVSSVPEVGGLAPPQRASPPSGSKRARGRA